MTHAEMYATFRTPFIFEWGNLNLRPASSQNRPGLLNDVGALKECDMQQLEYHTNIPDSGQIPLPADSKKESPTIFAGLQPRPLF